MSISFSDEAPQQVITSTRVLAEDHNEGNLRPQTLKDYVGQEKDIVSAELALVYRLCLRAVVRRAENILAEPLVAIGGRHYDTHKMIAAVCVAE